MHKEGYPLSSIGKLIGHYTREMYKEPEEAEAKPVEYPRSAGGGHIDTSRSQLNYQLGECHGTDWVKERLKGVYSRPQDWNKPKMLDIVVTLPTDEPPENARAFFEACYRSLCKQFQKKNNIVGAWIHMDEAQPHMHFAFLPIVDKTMKKNPEVKEGISTKAYFPSKSSLQQMHKTTEKDISEALGHRVAILNEATKTQGGNKSISQLKTESKKAMEKASEEKRALDDAKKGIDKGNEYEIFGLGFGEELYKVKPEAMRVVWKYAKAGAEAKATEEERQKELLNAKAKEKQADQEREAVSRQLAQAERHNEELRERLGEAEIFLEAPQSQREHLQNYAEYRREDFRDFSDCLHREAVRGYLGAGGKAEPVANAMGRALAYIGVEREQMGAYILSCVKACQTQARRFFKAREKGTFSPPPERVPTWWPDPQETDYSQQEEDPRHLSQLAKMEQERITKEKGNLFSRVVAMEKSKTASRGNIKGR